MRRLALLLGALVLAVALPAQSAPEGRVSSREVRNEVRATVAGQLDALKQEDFAKAYTFAALGIRRQFSLEVFEALIRRGYPQLLAHREHDFGVVRETRADRVFVDVDVIDPQGARTRFRYHLTRERAQWRIEGVVAIRSAPRGDS